MRWVVDNSLPSRALTNGHSVAVLEGLFGPGSLSDDDIPVSPDLIASGGFGATTVTSKESRLAENLRLLTTKLIPERTRLGDALKKLPTTDPMYAGMRARMDALTDGYMRISQGIRDGWYDEPPSALENLASIAKNAADAVIERLDELGGRGWAAGTSAVTTLYTDSKTGLDRLAKTGENVLTSGFDAAKWIGIGGLVLGTFLLLSGAVPGIPSIFKRRAVAARARRVRRRR